MRSLIRFACSVFTMVLLLGGTAGCSVFEVIDNMGSDGKTAETPAAQAASDPASSPQAKLKAYHNRRSKRVKADPNNPIVRCRAGGATTYLRRSDCQLRGGSEQV